MIDTPTDAVAPTVGMHELFRIVASLLLGLCVACGVGNTAGQPSPGLASGDIVFHTSRSDQSICLQRILKSRYTHMGLIYVGEDGNTYVYEAVQPVKRTPLSEWIERGEGGRYVVKRLREPLGDDELLRLKKAGQRFEGKPYDPYFQWSDDRIYCSELVWKIYKSALDVELGQLQRFGEFDLSDEQCSAILKKRFPDGICTDDSQLRCIDPLEPVVTPTAVFESGKLVTVLQD
jgi:hypothetical protein